MAEIITWSGGGGISFYVHGNEVRGFKDFQISASGETESKAQNGENLTRKKNSGGYQMSFTAVFNAALGVDVRTAALQLTEAARVCDTGYFYCGGAKLIPAPMMATDAKINDVTLTPSGEWFACTVPVTFKQSGKYGSDTASSKKKSKKKKSKNKNPTIPPTTAKKPHFADHTELTKLAINATNSAKAQSAKVRTDAASRRGGKTPTNSRRISGNQR